MKCIKINIITNGISPIELMHEINNLPANQSSLVCNIDQSGTLFCKTNKEPAGLVHKIEREHRVDVKITLVDKNKCLKINITKK